MALKRKRGVKDDVFSLRRRALSGSKPESSAMPRPLKAVVKAERMGSVGVVLGYCFLNSLHFFQAEIIISGKLKHRKVKPLA